MMPAPGSFADCRRLLAQVLGLGLLAGGVVLGAQGTVQALQYVFTGIANPADGLELDFIYRGTFTNAFAGSRRVTGSFNWVGSTGANTELTDVGVDFTVLTGTGSTVGASFSSVSPRVDAPPGRRLAWS